MADEAEISNELHEQFKDEQKHGVKPTEAGLRQALNREMRRRLERKPAQGPAPVVLTKPVSTAEAVDRVVDVMFSAYEGRLNESTVKTLEGFVSTYEAQMMEHAMRQGRPVPRELVRAALADIYAKHEAKQGRS